MDIHPKSGRESMNDRVEGTLHLKPKYNNVSKEKVTSLTHKDHLI
jgi:hypothetical protein